MKALKFSVSKDVFDNKDKYIAVPRFAESVLNLKGVDLLVYSVIYNFSQLEKREGKWVYLGSYYGSYATLADMVNATKGGVFKSIQNLLKAGFIFKQEVFKDGEKYCKFYAVPIEYECKETKKQDEETKIYLDEIDVNSEGEIIGETNELWEETKEKAEEIKPKKEAPKKEKVKQEPLINREPRNDMEKVEKVYLQNYQKLYDDGYLKMPKPVINWSASRRLTKDCIGKYGLQNIINAVNNAKNDDFTVSGGYCLTTILSAGNLAKLMNGTGKRLVKPFIRNKFIASDNCDLSEEEIPF